MVKRFTPPTRDQIIEAYGLPGDNRVARRLENYWRSLAKGGEGASDKWIGVIDGEAHDVWESSFNTARYELGPKKGIPSCSLENPKLLGRRLELAREEFVRQMWGKTERQE